jgi:hypothetical protein
VSAQPSPTSSDQPRNDASTSRLPAPLPDPAAGQATVPAAIGDGRATVPAAISDGHREPAPGDGRRGFTATLRALPGPLLLLVGAAEATSSVVRYDLRIVTVYTVLALLLAVWLWRSGAAVRLTPVTTATVLVAAALLILTAPAFTYLPAGSARTVRWLLAGAAVLAAIGQLLPWRHGADAGLLVAVGGYVVATVLLVHGDPAPRIDVWYTLQGAADALVHGGDPYTQVWIGPPGVMQAFTYLPWMAVLLAPGRWLAGDVRWALAVVTVAGALAVRGFGPRATPRSDRGIGRGTDRRLGRGTDRRLGRGTDRRLGGVPDRRAVAAAAGMAALLLLLPGTQTQVEQAWTEPLLLACLVGAGLALSRGRLLPAAVLLALGLASKQHIALLLPVLAAWPRVGWRRVVVVGGLAGLLVLPFFLTDPAAMWHDTISLLVSFPPLKFADTLFIAALNELHWLPPFWLTGALVLAAVGSASWAVHRRDPGVGEALRWCALVLLVANLLNKQAFYNQYWLVLALVVGSWAVPDTMPGRTSASDGGGTQPTG